MSNVKKKIERIKAALSHRESDRVAVGEFFWSGFISRCRKKWGDTFDAYRFWDLDYIVITPNMDPVIQQFDVVSQNEEDLLIKTGFGALIRRSGDKPMPHFDSFSVNEPSLMAKFGFDDPADTRRFYNGGDDQLNCVGDALLRNIPAWDERVNMYKDEFCLFGSVCEPYEYLWRIIGTENAMLWIASDPDEIKEFVDRIGKFMLLFAEAQIKAAAGRIQGMYIWGDIAYRNGMLFSPEVWRKVFKPHVKNIINLCHQHDLMVIYHGCGDARPIYGDLVQIGLDAYNPLEVKADLDVVKLKKEYKTKLAFCGNIDVRVLEKGDLKEIEAEILYKLHAAKGGGWICQSDHSISSYVAPESYDYALKTLRKHGKYPLNLK